MLEELVKHFVFIKDQATLVVVKRFIEATYFYDAFDHFPLLHFFGLSETGKTRQLKLIAYSCYHGFLTVDLTESVLFRTKEEEKAALCVDELESIFGLGVISPQRYAIQTIMNASYSRGFKVYRTEKVEDRFVRKGNNLYSPFVSAGTISVPPITLSRTIQLTTYRSETDYPEPRPELLKDIRDQLYVLRLQVGFLVKQMYEVINPETIMAEAARVEVVNEDTEQAVKTLSGRFIELFKPLLAVGEVFGTPEEQKVLAKFALEYEGSMRAEAVNISEEIEVLAQLKEYVGTEFDDREAGWLYIGPLKLLVNGVYETGITDKGVGTILHKLGLTKRRRSGGRFQFYASKKMVDDLCKRFGLDVKDLGQGAS
jgi:hypothetical protein